MRSPKAILFDLDGTLLDNDADRFVAAYLELLAAHVADLVPARPFVRALLAATERMVQNDDPSLTNAACFARDFFSQVGVPESALAPAFDEFYRLRYPELARLTQPRDGARAAVLAAREAGLQVVVATHPVFPADAIRQRLEWAGVGDLPFALVTSYELVHTSKPRPAYYLEIAASLGVGAVECVMVGDSHEMDISPSLSVGMYAYWVDERSALPAPAPALRLARGSLPELAHALSSGELLKLWDPR